MQFKHHYYLYHLNFPYIKRSPITLKNYTFSLLKNKQRVSSTIKEKTRFYAYKETCLRLVKIMLMLDVFLKDGNGR